jgi:acyl carrier protein
MAADHLHDELRTLLIEELELDGWPADATDQTPLFGEGLGLDSLDALQIAVAVEERYGVTIPESEEAKAILASISALATHVENVRTHEN